MKGFYTDHQLPREKTRKKESLTMPETTACWEDKRYNLRINRVYRQPTSQDCNEICHIMKSAKGTIIRDISQINLSNRKENGKIKFDSRQKLERVQNINGNNYLSGLPNVRGKTFT